MNCDNCAKMQVLMGGGGYLIALNDHLLTSRCLLQHRGVDVIQTSRFIVLKRCALRTASTAPLTGRVF